MTTIHLKFFASVRETLNCSELSLSLPGEVQTVGALRHHLQARGGVWAEALADSRALRMALAQQMCDADARLFDGAEVAFFPPVTGG